MHIHIQAENMIQYGQFLVKRINQSCLNTFLLQCHKTLCRTSTSKQVVGEEVHKLVVGALTSCWYWKYFKWQIICCHLLPSVLVFPVWMCPIPSCSFSSTTTDHSSVSVVAPTPLKGSATYPGWHSNLQTTFRFAKCYACKLPELHHSTNDKGEIGFSVGGSGNASCTSRLCAPVL